MLHPGMEEPFWHLKPTKFCKDTAEQEVTGGLLEWVGDGHIKEREEKGRKKGYRWVGVGSWMNREH